MGLYENDAHICSLLPKLSPTWPHQNTPKHKWSQTHPCNAPLITLGRYAHQAHLGRRPGELGEPGLPPSGTTIDLYIALKPESEYALIDALYEYGKHLSKEQVAELVAPHPNTVELVNSWLEHHGVPTSSITVTHGGGTLTLKGVSMTQANTLLNASYQLYRHVESSETIVRTLGYALPMTLHEHILTVVPTTTFFPQPRQWQIPQNFSGETPTWPVKSGLVEPVTTLSSRADTIKYPLTPSFLRWLYGTDKYVPAATNRNWLGIVGFSKDYPNPADLAAFLSKCRADAKDATYNVVPVNGGQYDPSKPTDEGALDIHVGDGPSGTDRLTAWLKFILDQPKVPQTISTSYGQDESLGTQEYSVYACFLLAQLGARGVSLLFSSGDDGVGKVKNCKAPDGSARFYVSFPASCPYVTAVGGTTSFEPERGAEMSGGGFSDYFPRPPYQNEAVGGFLDVLGNQYEGLFNPHGRGVPDVAAQVLAFPVYLKDQKKLLIGTSGATPVVAAIFSLLNDYQLSKGRDPLGWLNPWLYEDGFETLFDIVGGSNPGCGTLGFPAINGWDPLQVSEHLTFPICKKA
ncbi:peptidase S8/S53 domain-containing protein [Lactarius quietus]|nr:peptidase S8/S53 domain-containing protein [Lactarius quietus]